MAKSKPAGVCKLTGNHGIFVDSHLLPRALTRPNVAGNFFIENGYPHRPTKRFSSWYDPELCIRKGEDILAAYDDDGIKELRRLKLIWSGWAGLSKYIGPDFIPFSQLFMPGHGLRVLTDAKAKTLRMFFLSILWRAAATTRPEFADVQLEPDQLEFLRELVLASRDESDFFPITISQHITRGPTHNRAPVVLDRVHQNAEGKPFRMSVFRFWLEGLIVYFHRPGANVLVPPNNPHRVGHGEKLIVRCFPTEDSSEMIDLIRGLHEVHLQWPETMARLGAKAPIDYESMLRSYQSIVGPNHPWIARRE